MKKLLALLLIFALVFTLAACGGGNNAPDPEEVALEAYADILQRLSFEDGENGAYDIDFTIEMDMSFMGEDVTSVSTGNIRMIIDGETVEMFMLMEMDMSEMGAPNSIMEMYMLVEGDQLVDMSVVVDGMDLSDMLPEDMLEDMFGDVMDDTVSVPDFEDEALEWVEINEIDGNTEIRMLLDGDSLGAFVAESMEAQLADLAEMDGLELVYGFEDVLIVILLDSEDNPLSMTMEMDMNIVFHTDDPMLAELDGEEMSMRTVSIFTFNGFGDSVQIERV